MLPAAPLVWLLPEPPDLTGFAAPGWAVCPLSIDGPPAADPRMLLVGTVTDLATASAALAAAALGTAIAVHVELSAVDRHRFLEDLARLGLEPSEGTPTPPAPTAAQAALLDLLAAGSTVTAAAQALHQSRRTTNRMLQEVRALLGVDSNAEATQVWAGRRSGQAAP